MVKNLKINFLKNNNRYILVSIFILFNIILLFGISQVLLYFNEGADRKLILNLEAEPEVTYLPKVSWIKLNNPAREMEPMSLKRIEKHYLFGLLTKIRAQKNNDSLGLDDYFTENPLNEIKNLIKYNKKQNISIDGTTLSHNISLEFYSEDGQLVVLTDKRVEEFQNIYQNEKFIASIYDTVAYKNILLLEDGFWKVRQSIKINPEKDTLSEKILEPSIFTIKNKQFLKNGKPFVMKGMNYYPQKSPWQLFGNQFDEKTIASDFKLLNQSNINTIRIFVPFLDFGQNNLDENKINQLNRLISIAETQNLEVIITLFDFYGDYTPENWTITHRHAEKLVNSVKHHKNILAWDIKNEIDLDFENRGIHNVEPWMISIINIIKQNTNQLVTIGFYNEKQALKYEKIVDFLSFHFYKDANKLEETFNSINQNTKKPVVIQEFGMSTNFTFWNWFGNTKSNQKDYYQNCQKFFKKQNISFISWTLYDFESLPKEVFGNKFWVNHKQKNFGLIDLKGNKKPAFEFISY